MKLTAYTLSFITIVSLSTATGCLHGRAKNPLVKQSDEARVDHVAKDLVFPLASEPIGDTEMVGSELTLQTGDIPQPLVARDETDVAPIWLGDSSHPIDSMAEGATDLVEAELFEVSQASDFTDAPLSSLDVLSIGMIEENGSAVKTQPEISEQELASDAGDGGMVEVANPPVEFSLIESDRVDVLDGGRFYADDYDWNKDGLSLWAMQDFAASNIDTSGRVELNSIKVGEYAYLRDEVLPEGVYHPRSILSQTLIDSGKYRDDEKNDSVLNPVQKDTAVEQLKFGVHLFREYKPIYPECMNLGLGNITINNNAVALTFLNDYSERIPSYPELATVVEPGEATVFCKPTNWWDAKVTAPTRENAIPISLDVESLVLRTLQNSKYLQGLADLPVIREKATIEAIAEFDARTFMESRFRDRSEPVGNQLTVGPTGARRLREEDFTTTAGFRRKTTSGANVTVAQQVGLFNNNSTFLDPKHQGNSRLTLNVTQPLLSGSGRAYNTNLIMLAQMDERLAWDEVSAQLQDYLVEVMDAYWQLYLERARLKQKEESLSRAEGILAELEHRREIDALESQIASARSAVQNRRTELIRARTLVQNVESRLRALVNDPSLYGPGYEFVPGEYPACDRFSISMGDAMTQALESRAEIDKSIQNVRAAGVRLKVAKSELMPVLDLVLDSYISGLRGSNNIGGSIVDQFSVGEPSYSAGVLYELPWGNRLAENRHDRRRIEMRQAISQFEFQIEELMSEVEIAVRDVDTSYEEMLARHQSMEASRTELEYFMKRWELVPGDDRSASFLLEDILSAQERLAAAESNYAQSQISYTMSIVKAKRALGVLMKTERIEAIEQCESGLPRYIFEKGPTADFEFSESMIPISVEENPMKSLDRRPGTERESGLIYEESESGSSDYLEMNSQSPTLAPYPGGSYEPVINAPAPPRMKWESVLEEERSLMKETR